MKNEKAMRIIEKALRQGRKTLSEYESKQVLAAYDIPVTREVLVKDKTGLDKAIKKIGFPLVMKGCSADIAHKTEKGLIHVDIRTSTEAKKAFREIMAGMEGFEGGVLMQEMIKGRRELVMGLTRDPQFGPCVMFGLGGVFSELQKDVVFAPAPLSTSTAKELIRSISGKKLLQGFRGRKPLDMKLMIEVLVNLGNLATACLDIEQIDINPLVIYQGKPIAVDATVIKKAVG